MDEPSRDAPSAAARARGPIGWPAVLGLAVLHGALFFASFHPLALFPLAWVAFVPVALIIARGTRRQALTGGFFAALLGGGAGVWWLWLLEPVAWAGTAIGFGFYGILLAALGRPLSRRMPAAIFLPLAVVAEEWCRGHLFFVAFPWVFLGHSQIAIGPLVQAADLGGATLISFLVAGGNGVLADLILGVGRRRVLLEGAVVLAAGLLLSTYGALRERSIAVTEGPLLLAVQGNIPQTLKNEGLSDVFRTHYDLTMEAGKGKKIDLVGWPETMVFPEYRWEYERVRLPWPYDDGLRYAGLDVSARLRIPFKVMGGALGAHMLVGSVHEEVRGAEVVEHNSAFLLAPGGGVAGRYDKLYPAPMSEYIPWQGSQLNAYLRSTFVPPGFTQFEPGRGIPLWDIGGFKVAGSICFDITFPEATNRAVRDGADAIVNLSNYAWFLDSSELDLARVQTIFRAIETRRGVAACCNGGITCFVDPRGRTEDLWGVDKHGARSRKEVRGTLLRRLTTSRVRSLFVLLGDWVGGGATLVAMGLSLAFSAAPVFVRVRTREPV